MWRVKEAFGVMVVVLALILCGVEASPFVGAQSKPLHHDTRHVQVEHPHSSGLKRRDEGFCQEMEVPCSGHGVCNRWGNDCLCDVGWAGQDCETQDPCTNNPCQNDRYCITISDYAISPSVSYRCDCHGGYKIYTGKHCEHECRMALDFLDFDKKVYEATMQHSNLDEVCRDLVDELTETIEGAVQNGLNCHCDMWTFEKAAKLLSDKEEWTSRNCINSMNMNGDTPEGGSNSCTDQDILDCTKLVNYVSNSVMRLNSHDRSMIVEITVLVAETYDCMTELQQMPQWPSECKDMKVMFWLRPVELANALWTLLSQSCLAFSLINDECLKPVEDSCMMSATEFQEVTNNYVECAFATALQREECAGVGEYRNILTQYMDAYLAGFCPDQRQLEGIWNRTGCTNSPPWYSEVVSEPGQDVDEPDNLLRNVANGLTDVANELTDLETLIRKELDDPNHNK